VAIIGDDVISDLGGGAEELGLHRFLGKISDIDVVGCIDY
jgi:hypothetical protein